MQQVHLEQMLQQHRLQQIQERLYKVNTQDFMDQAAAKHEFIVHGQSSSETRASNGSPSQLYHHEEASMNIAPTDPLGATYPTSRAPVETCSWSEVTPTNGDFLGGASSWRPYQRGNEAEAGLIQALSSLSSDLGKTRSASKSSSKGGTYSPRQSAVRMQVVAT
jgi:hypothetical protein